MNKCVLNKISSNCTLRNALKGTNRVLHTHFHAS